MSDFYFDFEGLKQQADAWQAVSRLLKSIDTNYFSRADTGKECALHLIRELADKARAKDHNPAQGREQRHVSDEVFIDEFERWWEEEGEFIRAGGGAYEKSFAFGAWRHLYPRTLPNPPQPQSSGEEEREGGGNE